MTVNCVKFREGGEDRGLRVRKLCGSCLISLFVGKVESCVRTRVQIQDGNSLH